MEVTLIQFIITIFGISIMNVDESGIMFTKKKNKIDDEAPVSKKAARQQRKNINKTVINSILK